MKVQYIPVVSEQEIEETAKLAAQIWHEFFVCILSNEQIDYMLEKFQSKKAMMRQIEKEKYQYYRMQLGQKYIGYMGIKEEGNRLFLSKLYIEKENRRKGYASQAFAFLEEYCKNKGLQSAYLTVNKYNEHSIEVYKKKGFQIIKSQVTDIGEGFVMDDYVMKKTFEPLP